MKIFGWSVGFFCAFFAVGWLLSAKTAPVAILPTPPLPLVKNTAPMRPALPSEPRRNQQLLSGGQGADLFVALFDHDALEAQDLAEVLPLIEARFARPYSSGELASRRELVSRLGILKAVDETYGDSEDLFSFYRKILAKPREPLLVRRQALHNALGWIKTLPERDRNALIARTPASLLATAPLSEAELAERIFSHAK